MGALQALEESEQRGYTIQDIYALPDGQRAELIDGVIYDLAAPSTEHQRIVYYLGRQIGNYIDSHHGGCEVFPAPFAVYLTGDDRTYVEPDLSVICDQNKIDNRGCNGAPDWVIEIVSQSSKRMDYYTKLFQYRAAGVREYWIVDPIKKMVRIYDFSNGDTEDYSFSESVPCHIYSDFMIEFSAFV